MIKNENVNLKVAEPSVIAKAAVAVLIEKKALDVRLFEVGEENPMTDFYVNATGRSVNQVAALSDMLAEKLAEYGIDDAKIEGKRGNSWILIDCGVVIVNIFDKESRTFYNLDRLMPEGTEREISAVIKYVDDKMKINNTEE